MKNTPVHQIAPYLPFGVKAIFNESNDKKCRKKVIGTVSGVYSDGSIVCHDTVNASPDKFKLVLYPLSQLFGNISQHEAFTDYLSDYELSLITDHVLNEDDDCEFLSLISYSAAQYLFKHHFDVFYLIPIGQAVNGSKLKIK